MGWAVAEFYIYICQVRILEDSVDMSVGFRLECHGIWWISLGDAARNSQDLMGQIGFNQQFIKLGWIYRWQRIL